MTKDFEERLFTLAELAKLERELSVDELRLGLRDGRALVRANAALGLAVVGYGGRDLVPFLRDSDPMVAQAAAEALVHLGPAQREHLVPIAAALDGARPAVVALVVRMFSELIGRADAELVGVLETVDRAAAHAVVEASARVGLRGLQLLQGAAADARVLVRLNAVRGVGRLASVEPVSSIAVMQRCADDDTVPDVRETAMIALASYAARARVEAAARAGQPIPSKVPELFTRALSPDELKAAASGARLDELLAALDHVRVEIRLNGVRVLALQGAAAIPAVPALALAARDPDVVVRRESVTALAALARADVDVAAPLVRALADDDPAVLTTADAALAALGDAAAGALTDALATTSEPQGLRVAALIGRLADGPARLREALASTSVDARVHAARGLGLLGKARAGAVLAALTAATRGGNARVRAAVAAAVAMIDPRPQPSPPPLPIEGFDTRALTEAELGKQRAVLATAGVAGLAPRLADARPAVRANTALALGLVGGDDAAIADALAVCLRDDDADVRTGAARALARLGEPAIAACAGDIVRALAGADASLAPLLVGLLSAHAHPAIGAALVHGLDTHDDAFARSLLELVCARADAAELLCDAFERPGAQARAADGFVMLGAARVGRGRAVLARARTAPEAHVRTLARGALLAIDGAPAAPQPPAIAGFETTLLERGALATSLDVAALLPFLADGRAVVRANAATAIGAQGARAAACAITVAALLRDDDERVRLAAARALEQLGDDAVVAVAPQLVRALADESTAEPCRALLAARKAQVEGALVAGLDTPDEVHGVRVAELIAALPNGRELLFAAFDGPAYNVQINAGLGIGRLGAKKAGVEGRRRLLSGLPGPPTRRRYAMLAALAMLGDPAAR